jgi:predicted nucleic acid-binding protein
VIVVDASVLVVGLTDDGLDGAMARRRLRGEELAAPELIDLEVLSALRRHHARRLIDTRRAQLALTDLHDLPIHRAAHRPLLRRCWELRENVTPYDAAYVALAEAMETALVTMDLRLADAPGLQCPVEVIRPA